MIQAVVKIGKSQYLVQPGQQIAVDRLNTTQSSISFKEVLLLVEDGQVRIGQPHVPNITVEAKIMGEEKGEKIRVSKYKAKSRYRKTIGFRAKYSKILIENISETKTPRKTTKAKVSEK